MQRSAAADVGFHGRGSGMRTDGVARAEIRGTAYVLPDLVVTNEMLNAENPAWDMDRVITRTGVAMRHIARDDETAFDLACRASTRLFAEHPEAQSRIDAILFCTQSGDYPMPPNSSLLHEFLGLPESVFAIDFNLACSGFVYGLGLAQSLLASGVATNVLLVTADTYSKYINPRDRSARAVFGDAGAATWITASTTDRGLIGIECATSGKDHRKFIVPAGGCRLPLSQETAIERPDSSGNLRSLEDIHMDGAGVLSVVNATVPRQVRSLLERTHMTMEDIDLVIFHQASKMALDSLNTRLRIPPDKSFSNIRELGNTVSASLPIAIRDATDLGRIRPGDRIMLSGFGVGMSWATAILRM
jgi:3-oxoacyl-[acyl-carrier-protein] synthase III